MHALEDVLDGRLVLGSVVRMKKSLVAFRRASRSRKRGA